jgi:hypothetical protein
VGFMFLLSRFGQSIRFGVKLMLFQTVEIARSSLVRDLCARPCFKCYIYNLINQDIELVTGSEDS